MDKLEIYFSDLTKKAQDDLLECFGVDTPEEMNWDVFPLAEIHKEEVLDGQIQLGSACSDEGCC